MIRKFQEKDIDEVMNLWLNTNIQAHNFIDDYYWKNNFQVVKGLIPQAEVYIYEKNGEILGFAGVAENYIAGIFVKAEYQSCGIGNKILKHLKEIYSELTLKVYEKNSRAVNFYQRENFKIEAEDIDEAVNEKEFFMKWKK